MRAFFFVRTLLGTKAKSSFYPFSLFHSSRNGLASRSNLDLALKEFEQLQSLKLVEAGEEESHSHSASSQPIEIAHPWPEWVELMELLLRKGCFVGSSGFGGPNPKDSNKIRTACLNFARDRVGLIRFFSRKDIQVIVGCGCPSLDRKVVNSGKRLRAHVGINEGNVCSSCILRGSCDRAYVKARQDEEGRTVDVMRILLTYGLDPITGSVENKQCLNKTVKESVRRLLSQMVELSDKSNLGPAKITTKKLPFKGEQSIQQEMLKHKVDVPLKQGDWICPKYLTDPGILFLLKVYTYDDCGCLIGGLAFLNIGRCNFVNFARNIKCLRCDGVSQERLRTVEDQSHLPMKKGDWLCDKTQDVCSVQRSLQNDISIRESGNASREFFLLVEYLVYFIVSH
ncbi:hypothetical protein ACLOJK_007101 [Asimina triloba]